MPRASLACLAFLAACAKAPPAVVEVPGECADVFKGQICTYASMQGDSVTAVGATVPLASIENAPAEAAMTWPPKAEASLAVPAAAQRQSGLTQLTMFWEAMGHPPGAYLTPHFDFHFYTVPADQIAAMDCKDLSKPAELPAGYALPDVALPPDMAKMVGVGTLVGLCVPAMGMHALLSSELESTNIFTGSIVLGYYAAKPIFIEPMLTRAKLLQKQSFDLPIPAIPGLATPYPRQFRAEYDAQKDAYRFTFSGFAAGS